MRLIKKIIYRLPRLVLAPFIDFLGIGILPVSSADFSARGIPSGQSGLCFRDNGPRPPSRLSTPPARYELFISGARRSFLDLHDGGVEFVGAAFKPGALQVLTGVPAQALTDRILPLDRLWGRESDGLLERMVLAAGPWERLNLLEDHLAARISRLSRLDLFALQAARLIQVQGGGRSLSSFYGKTGYTQQHVARKFQECMGLSPKEYARITRFQNWFGKITLAGEPDWTQVAVDHGYFDAAHLFHDFRKFSNLNPTDFLRDFWRSGFPLPGLEGRKVLIYPGPNQKEWLKNLILEKLPPAPTQPTPETDSSQPAGKDCVPVGQDKSRRKNLLLNKATQLLVFLGGFTSSMVSGDFTFWSDFLGWMGDDLSSLPFFS